MPAKAGGRIGTQLRRSGSFALRSVFKVTIDKRPKYHFSLAFIFVIENAHCRKPYIDDQPEMPDWLHKDGRSMNSLLVRCTRALWDMPQWEQDEGSGQKDIMFVGDVKQKVAKIKSWMPPTRARPLSDAACCECSCECCDTTITSNTICVLER